MNLQKYKPNELLIGYEPFSGVANQFMLCLTEAGRDQVLNKLETMKTTYLHRIQQSKEVEPRPWQSQGSEEFVDQFQVKHTRKVVSASLLFALSLYLCSRVLWVLYSTTWDVAMTTQSILANTIFFCMACLYCKWVNSSFYFPSNVYKTIFIDRWL